MKKEENLHASCVAMQGRGILICGKSGAGKSSLALRLMALGASLVGDDQVLLRVQNGALLARPAPELAGKIEARQIGILKVPYSSEARIIAMVDLDREESERLPLPRFSKLLGQEIRLISGKNNLNLSSVLMALLNGGEIERE